ncbi:MAG: hypothetical protein ACI7YS_08425 [Flavobacterium sp.]
MKKKLESELISIAHRILKLKGKSELQQLHSETQKLYEKLSVLRFIEEQFQDIKPTIGQVEMEQKVETAFNEISSNYNMPEVSSDFQKEIISSEIVPTPINENIHSEEEEEEEISDLPEIGIESIPEMTPPSIVEIGEEETPLEPETEPEEESEEELKSDVQSPNVSAPVQISLEDLLGNSFTEPVFERVEKFSTEILPSEPEVNHEPVVAENVVEVIEPVAEIVESEPIVIESPVESQPEIEISPVVPMNEKAQKTITFGLNDKIGFEKNLFGGSSEEMNRVVSQVSTFDTFDEVVVFIEEMVKPDYHNWEGKEVYAERFMDIIAKKFE